MRGRSPPNLERARAGRGRHSRTVVHELGDRVLDVGEHRRLLRVGQPAGCVLGVEHRLLGSHATASIRFRKPSCSWRSPLWAERLAGLRSACRSDSEMPRNVTPVRTSAPMRPPPPRGPPKPGPPKPSWPPGPPPAAPEKRAPDLPRPGPPITSRPGRNRSSAFRHAERNGVREPSGCERRSFQRRPPRRLPGKLFTEI